MRNFVRPKSNPQRSPGHAHAPAHRQVLCPFETPLHAHWAVAHRVSMQWVQEIGYTDETGGTYALLDRAQFAWLAAAAYPYLAADQLQICADFMQWYFLYDDEYVNPEKPNALRGLIEIQDQLSAIFRFESPSGSGNPHLRGLADLHERILRHRGDRFWLERFYRNMKGYFEANRWVLLQRLRQTTAPLAEYMRFRWLDIGIPPSLDLGAYLWQIEPAQTFFYSSIFEELNRTTASAVFFTNDVLGWKKDQDLGDTTNAVFVLQREHGLTLDEALALTFQACNSEICSFQTLSAQLALFGFHLTPEIEKYLYLSRCWIRGHLDWYDVSHRYLNSDQLSAGTCPGGCFTSAAGDRVGKAASRVITTASCLL